MSNQFYHSTPIQVRFADIDSLNHVNNAKYLTYIESARIAYFNTVCERGMLDKPGIILAKTTIDFLLPVRIDDEIEVRTRCSRIGNKSFDLEYEIVKIGADSSVAAKVQTVQVAFDYESKETVAIPQAWKQKIEAFEKRGF